jgi:hypothetical protein
MKRLSILMVLVLSSLFHVPSAVNAAGCLSLTKWYPKEILSGKESNTGKLRFVSAAAVKSPDFNNVYFVAVKFKAIGVGSQVGVWAINGKLPQKPGDVSGLTLSVNSIAQQFTVWPDGNKTQAQIATNDRSVGAAIKCLKKKKKK